MLLRSERALLSWSQRLHVKAHSADLLGVAAPLVLLEVEFRNRTEVSRGRGYMRTASESVEKQDTLVPETWQQEQCMCAMAHFGANNGTTGRTSRVVVNSEVTVGRSRRECGWGGVESRAQVRQLFEAGSGATRRVNDTASQNSGQNADAQLTRITSRTTHSSVIADKPWEP